MWSKLVVNMTGSAIALATENRSSISRTDPALASIYLRAVREGLAIAKAHGYDLTDSIVPEALQANLLDHKPSLLQDFERGRMMELADIVEAPMALPGPRVFKRRSWTRYRRSSAGVQEIMVCTNKRTRPWTWTHQGAEEHCA